jgi:hypothetical protein
MQQEDRTTVEEVRMLLKYMAQGYKVPKEIYDVVWDAAKREIEGKHRIVLIKRDPNIQRGRIQAQYVKVIDGYTMDIHPCITGQFGADFDGDTVRCRFRCTCIRDEKKTGQIYESEVSCQLEDLIDESNAFEFKSKKITNSGVTVTKFVPKSDYTLYTDSINIDSGKTESKEITEYSIHENIDLYKISDTKNRFEEFWASSDHSLIVYDDEDQTIKKISPIELLQNPAGKYLIKKGKTNGTSNHKTGNRTD